MKKKKKVDFKEIGLDIGLILAKQFFNTEYLHYGYWTDDLAVETTNVYRAQENYADFIVSHIPESTKTILDVGCGAGKFAEKLLDLGYEVDCVSPSPNLTRHVRNFVGNRCEIFECGYEAVETDKTYDMVLFSESFQYIPLSDSFSQTMRFLKPGGHMLICDFFRRDDAEGTSPIGGGHGLKDFYEIAAKQPLSVLEDIDITKETAPSIDIVDNFLHNALHPIYDLIWYVLDNNRPFIAKLIRKKFRKRLDKINYKYLQRNHNGEIFAKFKSYHFLLYQRNDA